MGSSGGGIWIFAEFSSYCQCCAPPRRPGEDVVGLLNRCKALPRERLG